MLFIVSSHETKFEVVRGGSDEHGTLSINTPSLSQTTNSSSNERMNYAGDENSGESSDQSR